MAKTLVEKQEIPIINLAGIVSSNLNDLQSEQLVVDFFNAISGKGFALLINHGIPEDKIQKVWKHYDEFLILSPNIKNKYKRKYNKVHGLTEPGGELLNINNRLMELKYSFDVHYLQKDMFPEELPDFQQIVCELVEMFKSITFKLLRILAKALKIPENFFIERHKKILSCTDENTSILRLLYYPPIIDEENFSNIIRCGAHRDYGTFTFLAQDSEGGLEIRLPGQDWHRVGYLPGSIFLNFAEMLSIWTRDRFHAIEHRVIIPQEKHLQNTGRHALAFFVIPDNNIPIDPREIHINGESEDCCVDEKKTIYTSQQILQEKFNNTMFYK